MKNYRPVLWRVIRAKIMNNNFFDFSTFGPLDFSTFSFFNFLTFHLFEFSTFWLLHFWLYDFSTYRLFDLSIFQPLHFWICDFSTSRLCQFLTFRFSDFPNFRLHSFSTFQIFQLSTFQHLSLLFQNIVEYIQMYHWAWNTLSLSSFVIILTTFNLASLRYSSLNVCTLALCHNASDITCCDIILRHQEFV